MRETREEVVAKVRPKRIPVFEQNRNKISVSGLDQVNFQYRWVNDVDDRLQMFLEGGWEFADKHGKSVGDATVETAKGTGSTLSRNMGRGVIAFLMRIPKDIWLEDQKRKAEDQIQTHNKNMEKQAKQGADYGKITVEVKGEM
jgi:hypothetical protein